MGSFRQCYLACVLIDPLLEKLKQSGVGCHTNDNLMGVLSCADDITLICPSIWGLNEMLKICNTLNKKSIVFNKKKTTCIKFGDIIKNEKQAFLDGSELVWNDSVRHLGNFVDYFDGNAKKIFVYCSF